MVNDIFGGKPRSFPQPLQEHDVMTVVRTGNVLDWESRGNVVRPSTPGQIARYTTDRELSGMDLTIIPAPLESQAGNHLTTDGIRTKWSPDPGMIVAGDIIPTTSYIKITTIGDRKYLRSNNMEVLVCDGSTIDPIAYRYLTATTSLPKVITGDTAPLAITFPVDAGATGGRACVPYVVPGGTYAYILESRFNIAVSATYQYLYKYFYETNELVLLYSMAGVSTTGLEDSGGWLVVSEAGGWFAYHIGGTAFIADLATGSGIHYWALPNYHQSCSGGFAFVDSTGDILSVYSSPYPTSPGANNRYILQVDAPNDRYTVLASGIYENTTSATHWSAGSSEAGIDARIVTSGTPNVIGSNVEAGSAAQPIIHTIISDKDYDGFTGVFNNILTKTTTGPDGIYRTIAREPDGTVSWEETAPLFPVGSGSGVDSCFYGPENLAVTITDNPERSIIMSRHGLNADSFVVIGSLEALSPGFIQVETTHGLGRRGMGRGGSSYGVLVCGRVTNTTSSSAIWITYGQTAGVQLPTMANCFIATGSYRSIPLGLGTTQDPYIYFIGNASDITPYNVYMGLSSTGNLCRMNRGDPVSTITNRKLPGSAAYTVKQPIAVHEADAFVLDDSGAIYYSSDQLVTNPVLCVGSPNLPPAGGLATNGTITLFAAASGDLYSSVDNFDTAGTVVATGLPFISILFFGNYIFGAFGPSLYRAVSSDLATWDLVYTLTGGVIIDFTITEGYMALLSDTNEFYHAPNGSSIAKSQDCPAGAFKVCATPDLAYVFTTTGVFYKWTKNLGDAGGWYKTNIPATADYVGGFLDSEGIITSIGASATQPELYWQKIGGV